MKLYRSKIPQIAAAVVDTLCDEDAIDVAMENRSEAKQDIISIMEEYLRRDNDLRSRVREGMSDRAIGFENYGKERSRLAEEWKHPVGEEVGKFLARQIVENFMISRFVDEVYLEDGPIWRRVVDILRSFDVNEDDLREEAKGLIKNLREGTVDYEIAFEKALRDVKKKKGLI
ncbi:DUF507 family protein [Myxococcota bacterium]|jgi:hypothetical protein|nr:DUF507 family protein [Myxococcota bacterium]